MLFKENFEFELVRVDFPENTLLYRQIEREMNVQALLDHPSILKVYGAFEDETFIYMVQQLALNGDVYKTYLSQRVQLNEQELVVKIIAPLLQAVEHAHSRGVIHRDIKPENIFLSDSNHVLLGDWGLAIDNVQERPVSRVGTLDYMAPEVLRAPSIQPGVNFRENGCVNQSGSYDYSVCLSLHLSETDVYASVPFKVTQRHCLLRMMSLCCRWTFMQWAQLHMSLFMANHHFIDATERRRKPSFSRVS